jgi:HD-GYP domain-containing protein (c-di-GMP phosphodiesterase class II)
VAALVRASHERWDGAGYPDALAGEQIPVGARIVAVADAYAAMTAGRPYRKARSSNDALDELRREAGAQFAPAVVAAWCAQFERRSAAVVA